MRTQAVIGAGFGDEGKGKVVSYLCSQFENPLVVRYCGGQQAGHHVMLKDGSDHVFSNFGSGTLQGFATYWSRYCTVDPVGILNERDVLLSKRLLPILYLDAQCAVTTPYEKDFNQKAEEKNQHGSCGVGVGQTVQREKDHYSLTVADLYHPIALKIKLDLLQKYYGYTNDAIGQFLRNCEELVSTEGISLVEEMPCRFDQYIFEGSQGLLLDQNIGFFPHVTRANTGSKNIIDMNFRSEVFLVTRAYQTRHGNGPMTNESVPHTIMSNPYENNLDDGFQGKFRTSFLDLDLLKYAVQKDEYIRRADFNLVITCVDLMSEFTLTMHGKVVTFKSEDAFVDKVKTELNAVHVRVSKAPFPELETRS